MDSLAPGQHFAGTMVGMVVRALAGEPERLAAVLRAAHETRTPEELADPAGWSSYDQFRALLEATADALGGNDALVAIGADAVAEPTMPDIHGLLLSLGGPDALMHEIVSAGGASMVPISFVEGECIDAGEWRIRQRFRDGYAPFRAYCTFAAGLFHSIPSMFGLTGEVVEEQCEVDGAPCCVFHMRWGTTGEGPRHEFYEAKIEVLEAQLESLQATVADLVSGESLAGVLNRIMDSAARAVNAPWFILSLDDVRPDRVYARGLPVEDAARVVAELARDEPDDDDLSRLVVKVESTRQHYGMLIAVNPGGRFFSQQLTVLQAYARLAAAALDSATAIEDARRQAATSRVLLELAAELAGVTSMEEMAATLARTIPAVVNCDRAYVVLRHPNETFARVVSTYGYPADLSEWFRSLEVPIPSVSHERVTFYDSGDAPAGSLLREVMDRTGAVVFAAVPIVVDGSAEGFVIADVAEGPERLLGDDELRDRLRGLAAQASTALRNARLLDQVRHQALHDTLTGLPNRGLIFDRAEGMLARARRGGGPSAALFIDLDGFKDVNDALGHDAGDELLRAVTERLTSVLRESDTLGRLGGDEFVVLVENSDPEAVAQRVLDVLREPFALASAGGKYVRITGSVGVAVGDRVSATHLLRDADLALYEAKAAGRDRYVVFEPGLHAAAQRRRALEFDVRVAVERREVTLAYHPIVDLRTGAVTGMEALLRWDHPEWGAVPPQQYVAILEESGQVVEVGRWVLREACRQVGVWRARGHELDISVNVSPIQLDDPSFVDDVRAALAQSGLEPHALIVEVTETAVMRDTRTATERLQRVKDLGVRVAIDDFGTGWSSLAVLRQLPIDLLKIDRSFVEGIGNGVPDPVIDALLKLGKTMGLATLAEGIEEFRQYDGLQQADCDSGQGFLFARPLEPASVEEYLARHAARLAPRLPS